MDRKALQARISAASLYHGITPSLDKGALEHVKDCLRGTGEGDIVEYGLAFTFEFEGRMYGCIETTAYSFDRVLIVLQARDKTIHYVKIVEWEPGSVLVPKKIEEVPYPPTIEDWMAYQEHAVAFDVPGWYKHIPIPLPNKLISFEYEHVRYGMNDSLYLPGYTVRLPDGRLLRTKISRQEPHNEMWEFQRVWISLRGHVVQARKLDDLLKNGGQVR